MVDKKIKNMQQHTMYGVCILASFNQLTLTLAALCLRIKHTYFYSKNMPLEDAVILLEYPQ